MVDNGFGGCVNNRSNATQCLIGQFILNGNCLNSCPAGYFGNATSRSC